MEKSISKILEKHLSDSLQKHFKPDAFFILGVSGGPDSMALLYLFHLLGTDALVVHVNYGKRGEEADLDQELAEQMAFEWNFECCSIRVDSSQAEGSNFQNWAREQRYGFFRGLKDAHDADAIAIAHNQDDQVETILQKLFRGSSPAAWQGMKTWDGELFRPLLGFPKKQILEFCDYESIPYRIDESNLASDFARTFIRNEFSESMDSHFPGWKKNVLALQQQGEIFEGAMDVIADQVTKTNSIKLKEFSKLPDVLKTAVLKNILEKLDTGEVFSKGQLYELSQIENLQTGKSIEAGSLLLTRDREIIYIQPRKNPEKTDIKITRNQAEGGREIKGVYLELAEEVKSETLLRLDADLLEWPLTIRNWEAGDSMIPLGMSGTQKVSDHLTNRKIPAHLKEKALVLCGSDGTIYAIIYPVEARNAERGAIANMARCKPETQTFLKINNIEV